MTLFQGTQILGELRQHRKRNTGDFFFAFKKNIFIYYTCIVYLLIFIILYMCFCCCLFLSCCFFVLFCFVSFLFFSFLFYFFLGGGVGRGGGISRGKGTGNTCVLLQRDLFICYKQQGFL